MPERDGDGSSHPFEGVTGSGEAANGEIKIVVSIDGRHDAVTIGARAMRLSSGALSEQICRAMRDAHQQLFVGLNQRGREGADELQKEVDEMQAAYTARMDSYQQILVDIDRQLRGHFT